MREKILWDNNWQFHRGDILHEEPEVKGVMYMGAKTERYLMGPASPAYVSEVDGYNNKVEHRAERWYAVTLPHDYLIGDVPDPHKNCALGWVKYDNAWYRKRFTLPAEDQGRRLVLLFEGVATHATVYLNGCLMKHNFCGYTSFEVDITDVAKYGEENLLAVYVNCAEHEAWWYEGAGIYRHVYLIKTDSVAMTQWGTYVLPREGEDDLWTLRVENTVQNDRQSAVPVQVVSDILDHTGETIATLTCEGEIPPYSTVTLASTGWIKHPYRWDLDDPYLYTCRAHVLVGGEETDAYDTRFGFRTVRADPEQGLFLNGRHVLLKGVCGHENFGLTGKACPDNIFREKVLTLKEMGANAYRTSHYPQSSVLMDAFDELGMLVMDETRWFESTEEGLEQLTMLMKRDRNRPSVIMWSVGNEEPLFVTEQGRRICRRMMAHARCLDDSRFIMTANDKAPERATVYDECDIIGINYNLGMFEAVHEKYPHKAIFSSENAATGTTRGWYYPDDPQKGRCSAYDKDTNNWFLGREKTWRFLAGHPWIMGGFQWHAYEYRGEAVWPRLCSVSGAIDLFWQRKDAFYQNQSLWTEAPMVHLLPHWTFPGREGEEMRVSAYTNCEEVALFLNGACLGRCPVEQYSHAEWRVPYCPGRLEAIGYRAGQEVARDVRETADSGVRLHLSLMNHEAVRANGRDMALVCCTVLDAAGREVPQATPHVRFIAGEGITLYATGSDNTDHVSVFSHERRMYAGRVTAAAVAGTVPGKGRLYAEAEGLMSAWLDIPLIAE